MYVCMYVTSSGRFKVQGMIRTKTRTSPIPFFLAMSGDVCCSES